MLTDQVFATSFTERRVLAIYPHVSRRHLQAAINPLDQISIRDFPKVDGLSNDE
jgi:hypothetical protein